MDELEDVSFADAPEGWEDAARKQAIGWCALGRWGDDVLGRGYRFRMAQRADPTYWGGYFWEDYYEALGLGVVLCRIERGLRLLEPVGWGWVWRRVAYVMYECGLERIEVDGRTYGLYDALVEGIRRDMSVAQPTAVGWAWLAAYLRPRTFVTLWDGRMVIREQCLREAADGGGIWVARLVVRELPNALASELAPYAREVLATTTREVAFWGRRHGQWTVGGG